MVFRAAQGLHALAIGRSTRIDVMANRGGADKADRANIGMIKDRVDSFLVAIHHIHHTVGRAGLGHQTGQHHRRTGITLGWFQNKGVAAGQRHREHPHRHHRREIERGDTGHNANRLAQRIHIHTAGNLRRIFTFQRMRNAAGKFNNLQPAGNLALGIIKGLAMLR